MRPALWRLLKRPSTVSILDSLVAAPIGIEQLGPNHTCARCYAHGIQQRAVARSEPLAKELPARRGQAPDRRPSSFRVYDIDASNDPSDAQESLPTNDDPPESLSLRAERLEFESDIGHTDEIGTRLVDDPARRHDFLLWGELLCYRQRHYGDEGTLDIFNALTRRVDRVYLPVEGELADFFWRSFIDLGLKREHILDRLAAYAFKEWKEEGKRWGKFYECVVAGLFQRSQPHHAIKWHSRLRNPHLPRDGDIVRILEPALSAPANRLPFLTKGMRRHLSPGITAFQKICLSTRGSGLYRPVISTLLQLGYVEDALSMHEFLVKERQHAPSYQDVYPLLDYANKYGLWEDFLSLKRYANKRFPAEEPADGAETTDAKRPGTGAATSVKEKPLKDELGARLFATTALGLDTVLSGMEMFGVQAIGPLSLREMGVRSHGSGDIQEKLQKLQKARISIGDSVYARLFRKLATENRDILLSDLLKSDQHPDVLEDANTQEQMLATNYMARDSRQYNLTLAILGELFPDGAELSNVHFRKYIVSGELDLASKLVDEMALNSEGLSKQSVDFMVKRVLNVRSPAKNPTDRRHGRLPDGVGFVVRILQRTAAAGQYMPPEIWIEMLKRLGMTNRFDELRSCCLWLARFYTSRAKHSSGWARSPFPDKPESAHTTLSPDAAERMRQSVFNKHMQGAMVSWGFKMRISGHYQSKAYNPFGVYGEGLVPWTRGLVLLRDLEKEGVHLYVERIQKSCQQRLAMVFGPSIQSIRRMNRLLRRENPYSAKTTLGDIGRVWGEPLFGDRELDDIREVMKPPRATVKQLWRRRRRNQGTDDGVR